MAEGRRSTLAAPSATREGPVRERARTPSLRWFRGGGSYDEFRARYEAEPAAPEAAGLPDGLRASARVGRVTLLTASRTPERSHAQVLLELLGGRGQPVCRAACRPAARPENRQPPRKVPSSAL
ncbi:DUF488 family protein, N3 subclade [Streptomyces sp. NPDC001606]